MFKLMPFVIAGAATLAFAPAAMAVPTQSADVVFKAQSGKLKSNVYTNIEAYLATRDADSTRPTKQANPVGKVVMKFPPGSVITPTRTGKPLCNVSVFLGADIMAKCAKSEIGSGWALVNTGQDLGTGPRVQLDGAPAPCEATDTNQYAKTWNNGTLGCVPIYHVWNRVKVYLGGIPAGKTKPDSKSVIFVSQNMASIIAFGGSITNNVLTVNVPALYGAGSYPGELFFGWVLSDFRVILNTKNYFKVGVCKSRNFTVSTTTTYSPRKLEPGVPAPAGKTVVSKTPC